MNCSKCGSPVEEGSKFCKECGAQIAAKPESKGKPVMTQKYEAENPVQAQGFEAIEYMTSYLTFYLKGKVEFTRDNIRIQVPNTVLGLIPLGTNQSSINVNHITGATSDFSLILPFLIIGILGALMCLIETKNNPLVGLIGLIFFVNLALNAFQTKVSILLDSGPAYEIFLLFFEKEKAETIKTNIEMVTNARNYDTNVRIATETQTQQVVDAMNNLSSRN